LIGYHFLGYTSQTVSLIGYLAHGSIVIQVCFVWLAGPVSGVVTPALVGVVTTLDRSE
jgi:hypothetical protein